MKILLNVLILTFAVSSVISQVPSDSLVDNSVDSASLEIMVGQMIMTGIGDQSVMKKDHPLLDDIRNGKVGGVIFFEKNVNPDRPVEEIQNSIALMQDVAKVPLLVSIDEEGGRVNRLKPKYGFPKTQYANILGELDKLDSTRYYANNTASTLAMLGFNVNFAPDVDLIVNPENPVIAKAGRSYSADPDIVIKHATEFVKVHRENGIITSIKHFPGHGSSQSDTHWGVADVTNYWQFSELLPYKKMLDSGYVDCIMTSHIVNKNLDPGAFPATLSPLILKNVLRTFLEFDGVIFSDDMQMHAISRNFGFEESIKLAINAGVDMLVFANNVTGNERRTPGQIHAIIMDYIEKGEISESEIQDSYQRIMKLKTSRLK